MLEDRIEGEAFLNMLKGGYQNIAANYKEINFLNVFPVPDGDTGSNMKTTFSKGFSSIAERQNVSLMAQELANGMLFGARGNSGVLLSQYFRGIALGLDGIEEPTVNDFVSSLIQGYKSAYSAAIVPVEGTILTVAREGIENALPDFSPSDGLLEIVEKVIARMRVSLDNTPNLLPVLKEAGVIDSGGKGLLTIFEGFYLALSGKELPEVEGKIEEHRVTSCDFFDENSPLEYGYCTEFLLQLQNAKCPVDEFDIDPFIAFLQAHGDSVVCFQNGTIVKVHIHTKKPYRIIEFAQRYGEFVTFKMENMSIQFNEMQSLKDERKKERKEASFVAFANGQGMVKVFKDLGCDVVLDGGENMDVSVSEILDAFNRANAEHIFLLPNDANLALTVTHAASLAKGFNVHNVDTKSMQEGYFALSSLILGEMSLNEYEEALQNGKNAVLGGQVKQAKDGLGYFYSFEGKRLGTKPNGKEALLELFRSIEDMEDKEFAFIFYGESVSEEEVEEAKSALEEEYPYTEFGFLKGGQSKPRYMVGVQK